MIFEEFVAGMINRSLLRESQEVEPQRAKFPFASSDHMTE